MTIERRKYPRLWRGPLRINLFRLLVPHLPAICKNVSAGGLLIETSEALPLDRTVKFEIGLFGLQEFADRTGGNPGSSKNDIITGDAKVVRVSHVQGASALGWNTGLQFAGLTPETVQLLDKFISSKAGPGPAPGGHPR